MQYPKPCIEFYLCSRGRRNVNEEISSAVFDMDLTIDHME